MTHTISKTWLLMIIAASCISTLAVFSILKQCEIRSSGYPAKVQLLVTERMEETLRDCNLDDFVTAWVPHDATSRNLADFEDMIPDFVDWKNLLTKVAFGSVLEIGTGAGRALLDFKSTYPFAKAYGTNYKEYGFPQIEGSNESMWNVSTYFKIQIRCDQNGNPMFPTIMGLGKIQHEWLPFPSDSFDLIFSHHALNEGKLTPSESHCFIPRLHKVLKSGGMAVLHLLWDTGPVSPYLANFTDSALNIHGFKQSNQGTISQEIPLSKMVTVLLIMNIVTDTGKRTSILLFQTSGSFDKGTRNHTKFCVGMIMKKCAPNAAIHRQHQDCILPHDIQFDPHVIINANSFKLKADWRIGYHKKYLANLVKFLKQWSSDGRIPVNDTGDTSCAPV
jgi:SAM-dependent methyltransferase